MDLGDLILILICAVLFKVDFRFTSPEWMCGEPGES